MREQTGGGREARPGRADAPSATPISGAGGRRCRRSSPKRPRKAERRARGAEQGEAAPQAGRAAQPTRCHRAVGGQGVGRLGACNRASNSSRWCRPMRRSRSRPISPATTTASCMSATRWRSSSTPSRISQYGMADGHGADRQPGQLHARRTRRATRRARSRCRPIGTEPFYRAPHRDRPGGAARRAGGLPRHPRHAGDGRHQGRQAHRAADICSARCCRSPGRACASRDLPRATMSRRSPDRHWPRPQAALRRAVRLSEQGKVAAAFPLLAARRQGRHRRGGVPRRPLLSRRRRRAAEPGGRRALAASAPRRRACVEAQALLAALCAARPGGERRADERARRTGCSAGRARPSPTSTRPSNMGAAGGRGRLRRGPGAARLSPDSGPRSDARPRGGATLVRALGRGGLPAGHARLRPVAGAGHADDEDDRRACRRGTAPRRRGRTADRDLSARRA